VYSGGENNPLENNTIAKTKLKHAETFANIKLRSYFAP
jgi:hypothetical protein